MISVKSSLAKKAEDVFGELFMRIYQYLDVQSVNQMLLVSTEIYGITNEYYKQFLITNALVERDNKHHTLDHYVRLFRNFYSRELLLQPLSLIQDGISFKRHSRCSTYGVRDFELGFKFTVFQLYNKDIIFLKTEEYMEPNFCMEFINKRNMRNNVEKFFTQGKNLYYLTTTGQIYGIYFRDDKPSHEFPEGILDMTLLNPVKDCCFSYKKAVLIFAEKNIKSKDAKKEEVKEQSIKKKVDIRIWDVNELTAEAINEPDRLKPAEGLDKQEITGLVCGNNLAYLVDSEGITYECDFSVMNNNKYLIEQFAPLKNKKINRLFCSFSFFFALEQAEIKSIEDWNTEQICKWLDARGFSDYVNIVKYGTISGKDLKNGDRQYMLNALGVTREDLQIKLVNEVAEACKVKLEKPKIYGWGLNVNGQLGVDTGANNIPLPIEIPLPFNSGNNLIKDIVCGTHNSIIVTEDAGIWMTEIIEKKFPEKAPPKGKDEKGEKGKDEKSDKGKKNKKLSEDISAPEKEKPRWTNIQKSCQKLKQEKNYRTQSVSNNTYKVVKINLSKDYLVVLAANQGIIEEVEKKSRRADQIMDRIEWDKKLNKHEFAVGYEDRFVGILEIPYIEFIEKTDIPTHRIRYFKQSGELVWDRTKKINKL